MYELSEDVERDSKVVGMDAGAIGGEIGGELCYGEFVAKRTNEAAEVLN